MVGYFGRGTLVHVCRRGGCIGDECLGFSIVLLSTFGKEAYTLLARIVLNFAASCALLSAEERVHTYRILVYSKFNICTSHSEPSVCVFTTYCRALVLRVQVILFTSTRSIRIDLLSCSQISMSGTGWPLWALEGRALLATRPAARTPLASVSFTSTINATMV